MEENCIQKIFIIFNPNAGKAALKRINWAVDYFEGLGNEVTLFFSKKRGKTRLLAKDLAQEKPDIIVAAGGDGTINEVMDGLVGSTVPLGIIPFGTSNVFALEAGIPLSTPAACSVIKCGNIRKVNLGKANDRYFMLMASVGFDAEMIYRLSAHVPRQQGKSAFYFEALRGMLDYKSRFTSVLIDGVHSYRCYGVLVSNSSCCAGGVLESFNDDETVGEALEVSLCLRPNMWRMLLSALGTVFPGKMLDTSGWVTKKCTKLVIETGSDAVHVQADGDIVTSTPCSIQFCPEAVSLIVP